MTTFNSFRDGAGGQVCRQKLKLDISKLGTWSDFTQYVLGYRDKIGSEKFLKQMRQGYAEASTGESAIILGALFAADYTWLAEELTQEGGGFLAKMQYTFGDYAVAAAACLIRHD